MIITTQKPVPRYASFPTNASIYISDHRDIDQILAYTYSMPITFDQSVIDQIDGYLQIRGFLGKKKDDKIVVKKSIATGGNIFKSISKQRKKQIEDQRFEKRFFVKKDIERPDYLLEILDFQIDISSSDVIDSFILEMVNIKTDGSISIIDSIEISHSSKLKLYDLPNEDFLLSATRMNERTIYAAAASNDDLVGSFRFFIRYNASSTFASQRFENNIVVPVDSMNIATATFEVPDAEQSYTVMAKPISKFLNQEMGNYQEFTSGYVKNLKQIPMYVTSITDKTVTFKIEKVDSNIKKILLYRQLIPSGNRTFVSAVQAVDEGFTVSDQYRNPQYDFFYTVDYIDSQGIETTSSTEIVVPALKLDSLATIEVDRLSNQDSLNARYHTFNVKIDYKTLTAIDQITSDLKKLGLENLLSSELEKTTNNLKPLVRVLVTQILLETGIENDIGIYEPGIINIPINDSSNSIYRFEVAVRSVAETLETVTAAQNLISNNAYNLKSEVDLASKLIGNKTKVGQTSYSAKFFSRSSIRNSLLKYGNSTDLSDVSFYSGRTGIFYDVKITSSSKSSVKISNASFLETHRGFYIKWSYSGDPKLVNYFKITTDTQEFHSHPTDKTVQIFYLGKTKPKVIEVSPFLDKKTQPGSGKIEVQ